MLSRLRRTIRTTIVPGQTESETSTRCDTDTPTGSFIYSKLPTPTD